MKNKEIRWKVKNPLGQEIILKESTYQEHIDKDHQYEDSEYRKHAEEQAKITIEKPQMIIRNEDDQNRDMYYRIVTMEYEKEQKKLKNMKVIVETDREPNEIVTWILQSKLKDIVKEVWIRYAN